MEFEELKDIINSNVKNALEIGGPILLFTKKFPFYLYDKNNNLEESFYKNKYFDIKNTIYY